MRQLSCHRLRALESNRRILAGLKHFAHMQSLLKRLHDVGWPRRSREQPRTCMA